MSDNDKALAIAFLKQQRDNARSQIRDVRFVDVDNRVTICVVTTAAGCLVIAQHEVADPQEQHKELSQEIALEMAVNKLVEYENYFAARAEQLAAQIEQSAPKLS